MADIGPGLGDLNKARKVLRGPGNPRTKILRAIGVIIAGALSNPTKPGVPHANEVYEKRRRNGELADEFEERVGKQGGGGLVSYTSGVPGAQDP